tara:strand:- start:226 stop:942 length:717 start_codon:yes stop_codon:yes gene_type:complete
MTKKKTRKNRISEQEAARAIYIDFEANPYHRPSVLGVLYKNDFDNTSSFTQYVLEKRLHPTAKGCVASNLNEAVKMVLDIAGRENRLIISWSEKEINDVKEYCTLDLQESFEPFFVNAIPIAKEWHRIFKKGVEIPMTANRGRNTQEYYMKVINFGVPSIYGPGVASKPISEMREALTRNGGRYELVDPTLKSTWKSMLIHNEYDCRGLQRIMSKVSRDLMSQNWVQPAAMYTTHMAG